MNKAHIKTFIVGLLFLMLFTGGYAQKLPMRIPDFKLTAIDGKETGPSDYAGKIILVNFWATWCPPCVIEIPVLIDARKKYPDLVILGISMDIETERVAPFVKSKKINYPVLYGNNEVVQAFGGVRFIPQSFLYDRSGRLVRKFEGMISEKELNKAMKEIN